MAIIKNALLRYQTLDKCFRNTGKSYLIDDLLEAVNYALYEDNSESSGIKIRQLREDIRFMRSEIGYAAPIETKVISGKKEAYFYSDPKFSINSSPLNNTEITQFKSALTMLNRFEGSPGFEWMSEIAVILKDTIGNQIENEKVISFESNIDYVGYKYITKLFNSIINKSVLKIEYVPFGKEKYEFEFHPYYLKQFNNRWFVFGLHEEFGINTWNVALDRIEDISESTNKYIKNTIDWEYYFSEIYGVTKPKDKEEEIIELLFSSEQAPYIITKPLHQSQKDYEQENGLLVKLKLIPNFDFEQLILSFGERVKVVSPVDFKERIYSRVKASIKNYE
jgi:predicted DNA-binding transcriptional regulator YafY